MNQPMKAFTLGKGELAVLVDSWLRRMAVVAPVRARSAVRFDPVGSSDQVAWEYGGTTSPPSKVMYRSRQEILRFHRSDGWWRTEQVEVDEGPSVLLGVHPCDIHGILVLDRTLLGPHKDPWYQARRRSTYIVGLNCQTIGPLCFCASYGTGPFYQQWMGQGPPDGCDALLTSLGDRYLVEILGERGMELFEGGQEATGDDWERKRGLEAEARGRFRKTLETRDLPAMILRNLEHPVWERVGAGRCLSCTNCTMVCPTCYCYDLKDDVELNLKSIVRHRQWDSCQDQQFAKVHHGNYRATRKARLRQFVGHKLSYWVEQFGTFGCIGCGRCIHWCPTNIDLTEIAAEIRRGEQR